MPLNLPVIKLALVDDHRLFRKGLISLIHMIDREHAILFEADNGTELQEKITQENQPDLILMDINMPGMNGFSCIEWLSKHYPLVKVLVVSMIEQEDVIVKMLRMGVRGYLCKDVEPAELGEAIRSVADKGFYYTDFITGKLIHSLRSEQNEAAGKVNHLQFLNDKEREFLVWSCSEYTYNEIAAKMFLSPKTIDGYRSALFEKLNVKNRVGLALYAVKHGLIQL